MSDAANVAAAFAAGGMEGGGDSNEKMSAAKAKAYMNAMRIPEGTEFAKGIDDNLAKCNRRFFSVQIGPDLRYGEFEPADESGLYYVRGRRLNNPVLNRLVNRKTFTDRYAGFYYIEEEETGKGVRRYAYPSIPAWLGDPSRKQSHYEGAIIDARREDAGEPGTIETDVPIQLYEGLACPPSPDAPEEWSEKRRKDVEMLREILLVCSFGGNKANLDFYYKWVARVVKYPWKRTDVLLALIGEQQGTGKSVASNFPPALSGPRTA